MNQRTTRWIQLLGIGFIVFLCALSIDLAAHKRLWTDEGFEIWGTCAHAWNTIIQGAPGQCSRQPLYYIFLKALLTPLQSFGAGILVYYRTISLASTAILLSLLFVVLGRWLSWAAALTALIALSAQTTFIQYAAENRPYLLWLLFMTCFYLSLVRTRSHSALLWLSAVGLCCVAGPGAIQITSSLIAFALYHWWKKSPIHFKKILPYLGIFAVSIGVFLFYSKDTCNYTDGGDFDLLKTKNPKLIAAVLRLVWPKGFGIALLVKAAFVAGLVYLVQDLRGKKPFSKIAALGWISVSQLLLFFPLSIIIAIRHYFFTQRLFLFLLVPWAIVVAIGANYLLFESKLSRFLPRFQKTIYVALPLLLGLTAFQTSKEQLRLKTPFPEIACSQIPASGVSGMYFSELPFPDAFTHLLVDLDLAYKKCPINAEAPKQKLLFHKALDRSEGYRFEILDEPAQIQSTWIPVTQCGHQIDNLPFK